jgi:hypothetical protein
MGKEGLYAEDRTDVSRVLYSTAFKAICASLKNLAKFVMQTVIFG